MAQTSTDPSNQLMAALKSVHQMGLATPTPPDMQQQGAAPTDPSQDPNAQGGQDPTEQAVWDRFPGTDPQAVQQAAQQGGPDALAAILAQQEQDRQHLDELHMNAVQQLAQMLMPQGGGQAPAAAAPQGPGVGGDGTGY